MIYIWFTEERGRVSYLDHILMIFYSIHQLEEIIPYSLTLWDTVNNVNLLYGLLQFWCIYQFYLEQQRLDLHFFWVLL